MDQVWTKDDVLRKFVCSVGKEPAFYCVKDYDYENPEHYAS
jgi:hypothetical protein